MTIIVKLLVWTVLSLVVLGTAYYYFQDLEDKQLTNETRKELGGTFVELPNGFVHYQLEGSKKADLVVLVHGFGVPSYVWDPTYQFLLKRGFRVLRFDLFGSGLSDRPDAVYGLDLFSNQINDLLKALDINRPVQLMGLSMGGPVVTRFSHQHPEKVNALILQDPLVNQLDEKLIFPLDVPLLGEYIFCVYVTPGYVSGHKNDSKRGRYFARWGDEYKQQVQYKGFRKALLSSLRYMTQHPYIEEYQQLAKVKMPKLLIWGRDDKTIPISEASYLSTLMPDMDYHIIDGAGHHPSMEKPKAFNAVLLKFLRENPWKPKE